jgi:hypothetical protein
MLGEEAFGSVEDAIFGFGFGGVINLLNRFNHTYVSSVRLIQSAVK